jgi:hypothetical protein
MAVEHRPGGSGLAEVLEHQRARPHRAERVGDPAAGDVRRRAVHGLEHRREVALGVEVGRRRDPDAARHGRGEVAEDVAEQVRADDHVEARRVEHDLRAQRVDVLLAPLDVRVPGCALAHDLVPERHRVHDPVGLRRRRDVPAPGLRQRERVVDDPLRRPRA